jgi:hypothetical protein
VPRPRFDKPLVSGAEDTVGHDGPNSDPRLARRLAST